MERTINVTGTAKMGVHPDQIEIMITLQKRNRDFAKVMAASVDQTAQLKESLQQVGFKAADIKTTGFTVETVYDRSDNQNKLSGYQYLHNLKIVFANDSDRLSQVLTALMNCAAEPRFDISYTVKDQAKVKEKLMGRAVENGQRKAAILAQAAGAVLGELVNISYQRNNTEMYGRPVAFMGMRNETVAAGLDLQAEDITIEDEVSMTYCIK